MVAANPPPGKNNQGREYPALLPDPGNQLNGMVADQLLEGALSFPALSTLVT